MSAHWWIIVLALSAYGLISTALGMIIAHTTHTCPPPAEPAEADPDDWFA